MPPLPAFQLRLFSTLEQRLQSAGRDCMLSALERIEGSITELESSGMIPAEFLEFKVLGVRPLGDAGVVDAKVGIAELSALAERLSSLAGISPTDPFASGLVYADELCSAWSISRKTLDRLRKKGLPGRRIALADGRVRIGFSRAVVEAFAEKHGRSIARAGAFTRIPAEQQEEMIRRAIKYRRILKMTLNAAANRLAVRFDRSLEAVRQLLRRHDVRLQRAKSAADSRRIMQGVNEPQPPEPIFTESGPLNARRRALAFRAWRMGVDVGTIARKFRRSRASVRRAVCLSRAERLSSLLVGDALIGPVMPTFAMDGAEDVFLKSKPVCEGLGAGSPTDLLDFLDATRAKHPPLGHVERKRIESYQFLRHRARRLIETLGHSNPRAGSVDQIEVFLLWASRLKAELIRSQLPMMMNTISVRTGRVPSELPVQSLVKLLHAGIDEISRVVDRFDPTSTGRLAAPAAIAVDRTVAMMLRGELKSIVAQDSRRATAIIPRGVHFADWTLRVNPWQEELELDPRIRRFTECGDDTMQSRSAHVLRARYGLLGDPPRTLAELAASFDTTPARVAAMEHEFVVHALRVSRTAAVPASGA